MLSPVRKPSRPWGCLAPNIDVERVTRDAIKYQTRPTQARTYRGQPLRPDEVLYRARNAPTRYEETDHYFAHRELPPDQRLPSGELLSALHAYVSHFFARKEEGVGVEKQKLWRCMDETALIALGILVEESAREISGETGDLAFTEGVDGEGGLAQTYEERIEEIRERFRATNSVEDEEGNYDEDVDDAS